MPRFRKAIVRAGVYDIPREDGSTQSELITLDRLRHWAENANAMQSEGIRIPGPWTHEVSALPIQVGNDGTLSTSFNNAGFWDSFQVSLDEENVPTLYGVVDVPGKEDDPNSPAGKVGKTVKETSIYVRPAFKDGKGKEWKDALMHVALVTHPIEKGQKNFEGLALSMSHCSHALKMAMNSGDIVELIKNLRDVAKVSVPEDTSPENLIERLNAALLQKQLSEEENKPGNTRTPPSGARESNSPVITMSFSQQQAEALIKANVTNPATGKPFTVEDFTKAGVQMSAPPPAPVPAADLQQLQQANTVLMSHLKNSEIATRKARIESLIRNRRITKEYADASLAPMLQSFQMSFGQDGSLLPQPIDSVLNALETLPSAASPAPAPGLQAQHHLIPGNMNDLLNTLAMSLGGATEHTPNFPTAANQQMSPEDTKKLVDTFMANTQGF